MADHDRETAKRERAERLAGALRANLKRRKAQARQNAAKGRQDGRGGDTITGKDGPAGRGGSHGA